MLLRYKIKPLSPLMTPLMSDTFFGHFCWSLLFGHGEDYLEKFLSVYESEREAPVLFSSAFPEEMLPCPLLPLPGRGWIEEFAAALPAEEGMAEQEFKLWAYQRIKKAAKSAYITTGHWLEFKDSWSVEKHFERLCKEYMAASPKTPGNVTEMVTCNMMDRSVMNVGSEAGELFEREKVWHEDGLCFDLYVFLGSPDYKKDLEMFFREYLPQNGYGRDKSIGMGWMSFTEDLSFDETSFDVKDANSQMVLSLTAFEGIKYRASYRLKTKFGKLGGLFAISGPDGGRTRPFKKPILMMEPGTIVYTAESLQKEPLLKKVHSDPRIRHCGVPVTLPLKIEGMT